MARRSAVLVIDPHPPQDGPEGSAAVWGRWLARRTGASPISLPRFAAPRTVLDEAIKREAAWLVTGLPPLPAARDPMRRLDEDTALLLRRAPCPVLTVQPWAAAPAAAVRVAVAGVDGSAEARNAARAAASLLAAGSSVGRLVLAHGCATHPAELAARAPWPELARQMRPERHDWLTALARELRLPGLAVDPVVELTFAPDLVGGLAQCADAGFTALGISRRPEGCEARLGRLHRHVVGATPCPMLTTTCE